MIHQVQLYGSTATRNKLLKPELEPEGMGETDKVEEGSKIQRNPRGQPTAVCKQTWEKVYFPIRQIPKT